MTFLHVLIFQMLQQAIVSELLATQSAFAKRQETPRHAVTFFGRARQHASVTSSLHYRLPGRQTPRLFLDASIAQ